MQQAGRKSDSHHGSSCCWQAEVAGGLDTETSAGSGASFATDEGLSEQQIERSSKSLSSLKPVCALLYPWISGLSCFDFPKLLIPLSPYCHRGAPIPSFCRAPFCAGASMRMTLCSLPTMPVLCPQKECTYVVPSREPVLPALPSRTGRIWVRGTSARRRCWTGRRPSHCSRPRSRPRR